MLRSPLWAVMTEAVQAEMARLLKQNHVRYFSDLNADEQAALIDEVERNLASTRTHARCKPKLHLCYTVVLLPKWRSGCALMEASKLQLILNAAAEGATWLLRELPAEQKGMRLMFHCELPGPLRCHAWRHQLRGPRGRAAYLQRVSKSNRHHLARNTAITQHIETLPEKKPPK